jgi:hypothetical protein
MDMGAADVRVWIIIWICWGVREATSAASVAGIICPSPGVAAEAEATAAVRSGLEGGANVAAGNVFTGGPATPPEAGLAIGSAGGGGGGGGASLPLLSTQIPTR